MRILKMGAYPKGLKGSGVGVALLLAALLAPALGQTGRKQIRVILDTSKSMRTNDKPRLAPLSTLLLYDLALPNPTRGDSFEVITFHPTNKWSDPSSNPPTQTGPRIPLRDGRADLAGALNSVAYDADWTYYYPGLAQAIEDLGSGQLNRDDIRVIVIVTDGLPEPPTRQAELDRIRDLLPRLQSGGIRLYVLAFGPAAKDAGAGFFDQLVAKGGGEVFFDEDGSQLLVNMARIFSRSFGYTVDVPGPQTFPQVRALDLAGGQTPNRVAALMSWKRPSPPSLSLTPPAGGAVNSREKPEGSEVGASYALWWVLSPQKGDYGLQSNANGASVAVLRPSLLTMEVLAPKPEFQTYQTMAQVDFPLNVGLRPQAGAQGDTGEAELSFKAQGRRVFDSSRPEVRYEWYEEKGAPPASDRGTPTAQGRVYSVFPRFRQPKDDEEYYVGHLELEAHRGEALVAFLVHPVEVYPFVSLSPTPRQRDAQTSGGANVLKRRERGCATFRLELRDGRLPHAADPRYRLHAALKNPPSGPLQGASVTLDGLPLEVEGQPEKPPGVWYLAERRLSKDVLLGPHTACVQIGRPSSSDPAQVNPLEIVFTLQESPYQQFDVIESFELLTRVAPPPPVEAFVNWLPWLLLILMLLALWMTRYRPDLPEDLAMGLAPAGSGGGLVPLRLGAAPLSRRMFGLRADRPVYSENESDLLGWVRPQEDSLYSFRPATDVQVRSTESGEKVDFRGKQALLSVARTYRLQKGARDWLFRLEYR